MDYEIEIINLMFCFTCASCTVTFYVEQVAYTFDAGPNACLYLLEVNVEMVLSLVCHFFPPASTDNGENFVTGLTSKMTVPSDVSTFDY